VATNIHANVFESIKIFDNGEGGVMMSVEDWSEWLAGLKQAGLLRTPVTTESAPGPLIVIDGKSCHNYSSNDYLGLANHPVVREAAIRAVERYGVGSGASRLVSGTLSPHVALEERLADFKGTERALTFSSGYATAMGVIPALAGTGDVIVLDKLAHACLVDASKLSGAKLRVFAHNDLAQLEQRLDWARRTHPASRILIVTESVFSMDGDIAPLAGLVELKRKYGAELLLDEAHGVGVFGPGGRGLANELGVACGVDYHMGTLSKALGASGGYVAAPAGAIEWILNKARSFVYSTAPTSASAAAASAAIGISDSADGDQLRSRLQANYSVFVAEIALVSCPPVSLSPIIPVVVGGNEEALEAAKSLRLKGFFLPAIRYPTVPRGRARLRVSFSALHDCRVTKLLAGEIFSSLKKCLSA